VPKVIFVNRFFYPDHSATSQLLTDLVVNLYGRGMPVAVVCSRNSYQGKDVEKSLPALPDGIEVRRVWCSKRGHLGLIGKALDYLTFYITGTIELFRITESGDILVAKTDPPLIGIPTKLVARLKNARQVNWLQDVFPEIAAELKMFPRRVGLLTITKALRNRSLRNADVNVVLGERMHDKVAGFGVPESKILVIPNWADENTIFPLRSDTNPLKKEWNLQGKFVIGYSGNLGRAHEYQTVLDAAESFRQSSEIVFLWIGGGVKFADMKDEVKQRGLSNFLFRGYQDSGRLIESLNVPDVHLVILSPELEGLIVPSKFYGIAAAGRPVIFIGSKSGEIARLVKQYNCGLSVETGDPKELVRTIRWVMEHDEERKAMGENGREMIVRHFSRRNAHDAWWALIERLEPVGVLHRDTKVG